MPFQTLNAPWEKNFWISAPGWEKLPVWSDKYTIWVCNLNQVFPIYALIDFSRKKVDHIVCWLYDDGFCLHWQSGNPNNPKVHCVNNKRTVNSKAYEKK